MARKPSVESRQALNFALLEDRDRIRLEVIGVSKSGTINLRRKETAGCGARGTDRMEIELSLIALVPPAFDDTLEELFPDKYGPLPEAKSRLSSLRTEYRAWYLCRFHEVKPTRSCYERAWQAWDRLVRAGIQVVNPTE